ncbi:MAG TPA: DUF3106 domain-containing protein [Burkholderiaceae bacterium]|nr:DUF3106 domain-containing protein [Burkholderiaceae bacterium]
MRYLLCLLPACMAAGVALAQTPAAGASAATSHARSVARPAWRELNADQREALAPLAGEWDKFDPDRKKKWLEIAAKYPNMSAEGKQRFHERMPQLAKLTPEQRETTRENFRRAYALPADQRQALTQKYRELPEDRKRALAAQAKAKKPAQSPRRPATPLKEASSVSPTR